MQAVRGFSSLARRSVSVARSAVPVVQTRGYADDGPATAISLTFTTPHLVSSKDLIFLLLLRAPRPAPMWGARAGTTGSAPLLVILAVWHVPARCCCTTCPEL